MTIEAAPVVSQIQSILAGRMAPVYWFRTGNRLTFDSEPVGSRAACFSFYAKCVAGGPRLTVRFFDNARIALTTRKFEITNSWNRYSLAISADEPFGKVKAELDLDPGQIYSACAVDLLQIEKGLTPTSPIPPGQKHRDGDSLYWSLGPNGAMGTRGAVAVQAFCGSWVSHQMVAGDYRTVFSLVRNNGDAVIACFSGDHDGALCLVRRENGVDDFICTSAYLNEPGKHMVILSYDLYSTYLYFDGIPVLTTELVGPDTFTRLYAGCAPHAAALDMPAVWQLSGHIGPVQWWERSLYHREILELTDSIRPTIRPRVQGQDLVDLYFCEKSAEEFLDELCYCLENVAEYTKPDDLEERIRDCYALLFRGRNREIQREDFKAIGRTDLTLRYTDLKQERIRIEFKIWGHRGFKEIPRQPIKYMSPQEKIAVCIIYDYGATDKFQKLLDILKDNEYYEMTNLYVDAGNILFKEPHRATLSEYERNPGDRVCVLSLYVRYPRNRAADK